MKNIRLIILSSAVVVLCFIFYIAIFKKIIDSSLSPIQTTIVAYSLNKVEYLTDRKTYMRLLAAGSYAAKNKVNNYDDTVTLYENLLKNIKLNVHGKAELYRSLANIYFLKGNYENALANYKNVLALNPSCALSKGNSAYINQILKTAYNPNELLEIIKTEDIKHQSSFIQNQQEEYRRLLTQISKINKNLTLQIRQSLRDTEKLKNENTVAFVYELKRMQTSKKSLEKQKSQLEKSLQKSQKILKEKLNKDYGVAQQEPITDKKERRTESIKSALQQKDIVNILEIKKDELHKTAEENIQEKNYSLDAVDNIENLIVNEILIAGKILKYDEFKNKYITPYNDILKISDNTDFSSGYNISDENGIYETVKNIFVVIAKRKKEITELANKKQMAVIEELCSVNKKLVEINSHKISQLTNQQTELNQSLQNVRTEKKNIANETRRARTPKEQDKLKQKFNDISKLEKSIGQELKKVQSDKNAIEEHLNHIVFENEKFINLLKENKIDRQNINVEKAKSNAEFIAVQFASLSEENNNKVAFAELLLILQKYLIEQSLDEEEIYKVQIESFVKDNIKSQNEQENPNDKFFDIYLKAIQEEVTASQEKIEYFINQQERTEKLFNVNNLYEKNKLNAKLLDLLKQNVENHKTLLNSQKSVFDKVFQLIANTQRTSSSLLQEKDLILNRLNACKTKQQNSENSSENTADIKTEEAELQKKYNNLQMKQVDLIAETAEQIAVSFNDIQENIFFEKLEVLLEDIDKTSVALYKNIKRNVDFNLICSYDKLNRFTKDKESQQYKQALQKYEQAQKAEEEFIEKNINFAQEEYKFICSYQNILSASETEILERTIKNEKELDKKADIERLKEEIDKFETMQNSTVAIYKQDFALIENIDELIKLYKVYLLDFVSYFELKQNNLLDMIDSLEKTSLNIKKEKLSQEEKIISQEIQSLQTAEKQNENSAEKSSVTNSDNIQQKLEEQKVARQIKQEEAELINRKNSISTQLHNCAVSFENMITRIVAKQEKIIYLQKIIDKKVSNIESKFIATLETKLNDSNTATDVASQHKNVKYIAETLNKYRNEIKNEKDFSDVINKSSEVSLKVFKELLQEDLEEQTDENPLEKEKKQYEKSLNELKQKSVELLQKSETARYELIETLIEKHQNDYYVELSENEIVTLKKEIKRQRDLVGKAQHKLKKLELKQKDYEIELEKFRHNKETDKIAKTEKKIVSLVEIRQNENKEYSSLCATLKELQEEYDKTYFNIKSYGAKSQQNNSAVIKLKEKIAELEKEKLKTEIEFSSVTKQLSDVNAKIANDIQEGAK